MSQDEIVALDGGHGFGLLNRGSTLRGGTAVVLFNAGLIHRVGPFRVYVHLARRLAARGVHVLRFDLPRVGDGSGDARINGDGAVAAALDAVKRETGCRELVVGGICSAADLAWKTAVRDPRVTGVLLFDGFARRNAWFRFGQAMLALRRPVATWPSLLLKALRYRPGTAIDVRNYRDWPEPDEFLREAEALLQRGTRILALYTGGIATYLLHRRQLDGTFGRMRGHRNLELRYWPAYDHILFSAVEREDVIRTIAEWAGEFRSDATTPVAVAHGRPALA
jgi:hypothetical protein